jgi:hypothetical protein
MIIVPYEYGQEMEMDDFVRDWCLGSEVEIHHCHVAGKQLFTMEG